MTLTLAALTIFLTLLIPSHTQSVQSYVSSRGCNTAVVSGLSKQLVRQTNLLQPGLFSDISSISGVRLSTSAQAVPYLQKAAADALARAARSRGSSLTVNSALRTLPQQLLLYKWYQMGACGISAAAQPGRSNHNGGLAVDVQDPYSWISAMSSASFRHLGAGDPPHFDYKGSGARDVRSLSVRAFQVLWNTNNPSDRLPEDGVYSSAVESRLLRSPANGFANGPRGGSSGGSGSGSGGGQSQQQPTQPSRNSFGSCNPNGESGVCIDINAGTCSGEVYRGFCPGASNIRCCVQSQAVADSQSSLATENSGTSTSNSVGVTVAVGIIGAIIVTLLVGIIILLSRKLKSYDKS